ncbi:MAG: carotenoid oxygenase family protein [Acidimicrobiales bacterium]|nr:carotenoid oxygenase family protein [Acidimicrobiales bacterium]
MGGARLDRRRFLGLATAALAGAACRGADDPVARSGSSTSASTTTPPYRLDPDVPYWLQGNYAPVSEEVEAFDLAVTGSLPAGLNGLYVRNGSNPATGSSPHWFLGDGMVHGVRLEAGNARWYRNRYVDTPLYRTRREFGDLDAGAPGTQNSQSNVSVFEHQGRLLSSGEVGWPYALDPTDLSTEGATDLRGPAGALGANFTAHPKVDPETGELHAFGYGFVAPYLTYYRIGVDGTLVQSEQIEVAGPTMMHDFAITDREAVFWEFPVVFDLDAALEGTGFPFVWTPDYGSRVGVLPFGAPGTDIRWVEIPNQMVFHGTNAYRDGDEIVLDVNVQASAFDPAGDPPGSVLHRWRIDTSGEVLSFRDEQLADRWMDFPRIDPRQTGRPHGRAWYVDFTDTEDEGMLFRGITGVSGGREVTAWRPHEAEHAGEVTFVSDPERGNGGGWLLGFVYDRRTDASSLVVLDPDDLVAGPVARVELPQRVPFGFHGTWVPAV